MSQLHQRSVWVRVPASAGNFAGAGYGAALALDCPMNVKVTAQPDNQVLVRYFGEDGQGIPRDASNLVIQAVRACLSSCGRPLMGVGVEIYSCVPPGVGLGASAAAVWAGSIAANALYDLGFGQKELFSVVESLEPSKANIQAAWFGGLAVFTETGSAYRTALVPKDFKLAVVIPSLASPTGKRSGIDQNHASHAAEQATAAARFLAQGGRSGSFNTSASIPGELAAAVPGLEDALEISAPGLLGAFVCGSGPSLGLLTEENSTEAIEAVRACFSRRGIETRLREFQASSTGAREWNAWSATDARGIELRESPLVAVAGQPA